MESLEALNALLTAREDEHVECKEAKNQFDSERLIEYCVALANEGGGKLVPGVSDEPTASGEPRLVAGIQDPRQTKRNDIEHVVTDIIMS